MAHFAKIEDSIVRQVIVVNNEVLNNAEGTDGEAIGIAFCKSLYGEDTTWVQTSYNASFRGKFAGMGDTWDGTNFVSPVVEDAK
jgi:hypothetical protein